MEARFDLARLFGEVDAQRTSRGLTWTAVASQVGVSTSTIRRFSDADDAEADGVLALCRWLEVAPERFVDASTVAGAVLDPPGWGVVRVDMAAVRDVAGPSAGGGTRTTIQRLTIVAAGAGRPIGSLTRLSPS